jgi:hypothetical protein
VPYIKSLEASIPLIKAAGWEEGYAQELGNPYISAARAFMTRKALDAKADVIIYLDYDLSWEPQDLLTLIETPGDVVAGTYRYKQAEEDYMGEIVIGSKYGKSHPIGRQDGCLKAIWAPAGFLKITVDCLKRFMKSYPQLCFGEAYRYSVDLFQHGACEGVWYGEDVMFSKRWRECGGDVWIVPNLSLTHWDKEKDYPGNLHQYLLRRGEETHSKAA